jgi:hypothetical protein
LNLHLRIIRDIGSSAVVLFAVSAPDGSNKLKLAGSGTFVSDGTSYWILTAAHVWKDVLADAEKLGITLTTNIDHSSLLDISALQANTFKPIGDWNEWGPDLALIRVPPVVVGTIEAHKTFYYWRQEPPQFLDCESLECFYLLGTPEDLGVFTEVHADVEIRGFLALMVDQKDFGDFDFIDVDANVIQGGQMTGFGGVSGGGLWRVRIFINPKTGLPDWAWRLEGTAFFQFPIQGTSAIIRCHGPNSISKAITSTTNS